MSHDEDEKKKTSKIGANVACNETKCRWYRYWCNRNFRRDTCGSRHRIGTILSHVYRKPAYFSRLAATLRRRHRRDGVDRRLLDSPISDPGSASHRSSFGECATRPSRAWAQVRRAGLPMASISTFGWPAAGIVS